MTDFPHHDALNLNGVMRRAVELLEADFQLLGIEVAAFLEEGLPDIRGDYNRTLQVAVNLLSNARDALIEPTALRPRRIEVSTFSTNGEVGLAIEDSGPGIRREDRERIFEAYYSTKGFSRATGLGLSVCHEIVSMQDGTLSVEDGVLGGARFVARFPAASNFEESEISPRILFVGGDLEVQRAMAGFLPDGGATARGAPARGASARIAESELAAVALLRSGNFDLVVADYYLSGMTACALLEAIAPFLESHPAPAIIIHDRRTDEIAAGGHFFLQRPVTAESLRRAIREAWR